MNIKSAPISHMKIENLKEADYNPRKRLKQGDPAYERIKHSILTYGMVDPLVYNKRTGRLVGGHQRLTILKDLGVETAPVAVVDLSETQEKDLNIRLNKVQGEFDDDSLATILKELESEDFDLNQMGFEDSEVQDIFMRMELENEQTGDFLNHLITNDDAGDAGPLEEETEQDWTDDESRPTATPTNHHESNNSKGSKRPSESDSEPYTKEDGGEFFKMTFPVDFDEREIILQALKKAKQNFGVTTSTEALLRICHTFSGSSK